MTCLRKFNYFFNDESEENWINEMSAKGWHFKQFRLGMYAFEKGEPGEYIYRVDYLDKLGFGKAVKECIAVCLKPRQSIIWKIRRTGQKQ